MPGIVFFPWLSLAELIPLKVWCFCAFQQVLMFDDMGKVAFCCCHERSEQVLLKQSWQKGFCACQANTQQGSEFACFERSLLAADCATLQWTMPWKVVLLQLYYFTQQPGLVEVGRRSEKKTLRVSSLTGTEKQRNLLGTQSRFCLGNTNFNLKKWNLIGLPKWIPILLHISSWHDHSVELLDCADFGNLPLFYCTEHFREFKQLLIIFVETFIHCR